MKRVVFVAFFLLMLAGCQKTDHNLITKWKSEVAKAESDFEIYLSENGIRKAFVAFADDSAVLLRSDSLILGKQAIDKYYTPFENTNMSLRWKPNRIEVALSGDMASTWGKYHFTRTNPDGSMQHTEGYFHTVWKRQADGKWKYIWD